MEMKGVLPAEHRYFATNKTTYKCDSGYRLRGSVNRFCLANGKWNGSTPICSPHNDCQDPGIPAGSFRSGETFNIDYEVIYSCNHDLMYLVGSKVRRCQENGQWTGTEPSCFYTYTYDIAEDINAEFAAAMELNLSELTSMTQKRKEG
ncbi:hypothetical protein CRUP_037263 [Coryphaenoides rupestris]|nr:hypothetical protein CRUP_037263 [Coryphaenoides rupestris]